MRSIWPVFWGAAIAVLGAGAPLAAEPLPSAGGGERYAQSDAYRPPEDRYDSRRDDGPGGQARGDDSYRPDGEAGSREGGLYDEPPRDGARDAYDGGGAGEPYDAPREARRYDGDRDGGPDTGRDETYEKGEILNAGRRFFGSISEGLARVVERAFRSEGRPNGYILGEDAGGAFVAGLRYGEGTLYTKYDGDHKVYWQGPSIGYDFGGEGSKTMVLVYNLREPSDIYHRFPGVQGSAYLVGGVGIQFQKYGDIVLAPIRSGVGLRLGANVGYLKYTRSPTWNPF